MSSASSFSHKKIKSERLALSRLITEIERDTSLGHQALNELFAHTGQAHLIGVTGAPGTGKSSLVNQLALHYRRDLDQRIAIVAVDPSSPFSGGAVLGDRIRMQDLIGDHNVFIRSMASRGSLGGLATATAGVVQALDAADFDTIIIETVGAGQAEVEIAKLAHTTIVVEAPGLGDDVQAIKAGILEIADILVLNKSDRPGVEAAERALTGMLKLGHPLERNFLHHGQTMSIEQSESAEQSPDIWIPSLLRTVSTDGQGIPELLKLIAVHKQFLQESGEWQLRDRTRLENELELLLTREMMREWHAESNVANWEATLQAIQERKLSPRNAVNKLLNGRSSA